MHNDSTITLSSSTSSSSASASSSPSAFAAAPAASAALLVLRIAKRLHKAALEGAPNQALPVLRRVLASGSLRDLSLPQLHKNRALVRRKHILRTLAVEAGYASWEHYRAALATLPVEELPHFDLVRSQAGYPNLWFASVAEAQAYTAQHGGRMMAVGEQAVVLVPGEQAA